MKSTLLIILVSLSLAALAQQPALPKIIPPSPNAASLAQYGDIPVSNYTGIPSISIPLFNVKSGNINLPVTLSYHASGVKVPQEASWVGLAWSLNAGGVITRQVRGFDDFEPNGGYITTPIPPSTAENLPDQTNYQAWLSYYSMLNSNDPSARMDGEPDIFYYNFLGYSGKFVFEQQTYSNGFKAVSVDQNNLVISYDRVSKQWTVTDGNGWKYYFGTYAAEAIEETTSYSYSTADAFNTVSNQNIVSNRRLTQYTATDENVITGWYLTKVESQEGAIIEFFYDTGNYQTLSEVSYNERRRQQVNVQASYINGPNPLFPSIDGNQTLNTFSQQLVEDVYLKSIHFANGRLEFTTADRDDLRVNNFGATPSKAQRLNTIELLDINDNLIKKVEFNYSYFNPSYLNATNAADYLRLKLDSVTEVYQQSPGVYVNRPPHSFTYNATPLPDKLSFSIDHWGYYNYAQNANIYLYKYIYQPNAQSPSGVGVNTSYAALNSTPVSMLSPTYRDLTFQWDCLFCRGGPEAQYRWYQSGNIGIDYLSDGRYNQFYLRAERLL